MSVLNQKTINETISIEGIGLHTGELVNMKINPAAPNTSNSSPVINAFTNINSVTIPKRTKNSEKISIIDLAIAESKAESCKFLINDAELFSR